MVDNIASFIIMEQGQIMMQVGKLSNNSGKGQDVRVTSWNLARAKGAASDKNVTADCTKNFSILLWIQS